MEAIDQLIVTLGQRLKQAKQAKRLFADDLALLHRMALTYDCQLFLLMVELQAAGAPPDRWGRRTI